MANHPKISDWKQYEELIDAGIHGWNPLKDLPRVMSKEFSWMQDFEFGFFSEDDIPHVRTQGWKFLMTDHFGGEGGVASFNKVVGLRFGLSNTDGRVKFRDNFIMLSPRQTREKVVEARNEHSENMFRANVEGQTYVLPGTEPDENTSEYEEVVTTIMKPDSDKAPKKAPKKRGPGRPRKIKE